MTMSDTNQYVDHEKIRKIASDICLVKQNCNDVCNPTESCAAYKHAKKAVEAGYSPKPELTDTCSLCTALANHKETCEYYRRSSDTSVSEYTAALVHRSYQDDYPSGQVTQYGFELNFCPECGKELREKKYEVDKNQED